ncbi:MAG TPA: carbamate kinase [Thermoanaerobaculia bacterium]|nr:carbamate kinase [Thermoanaerobaculia bacterium]
MSPSSRPARQPAAPTVVVAMGGHAFLLPGQRGTYGEHIANARGVCRHLMTFVERGYNLVITHGNGPQVGDLLTQTELARKEVPPLPLEVLVAQTEGSLGYFLQLALLNELRSRGIRRYVVTVVTQVTVDRLDPAFLEPTKPVGPFYSEAQARALAAERGWHVGEDAGRGWRRLVPSPRPLKVIQRGMVDEAARAGHIVIAGGGGGIPVAKSESNDYQGVEAVIDKDLTASVLATDVGAELLVILTAVDAVSLNFGRPDEQRLGAVTLSECERYLREGHFAAGSMGPKVEAVYQFLKRGGRRGLITSPDRLHEALDGTAGTHFVGRL